MHSHLYVLTGASRGLGAALAEQLLHDPRNRLLGLSRHVEPALDACASASGAALEQWPIDLAQPVEAAARVEAWLRSQDATAYDSASLINNAAALTRAGALDDVAADELSRALRVGLEAPLLLTAAFLRATRGWRAERRVLNVSSGLGRRAMAGQAAYCAVKAGLDHATRALVLDEALHAAPARLASVAPGVIDTDMQRALRTADPSAFPEHARFVELQRSGRLSSPQAAAARLLECLERADFGAQPVTDVREL